MLNIDNKLVKELYFCKVYTPYPHNEYEVYDKNNNDKLVARIFEYTSSILVRCEDGEGTVILEIENVKKGKSYINEIVNAIRT